MLSLVFKQNIYNGVFDDIEPNEVPKEINFFNLRAAFDTYPLTEHAFEHIQTVELSKGDCVFIPALYWTQTRIDSVNAMHLSFNFEESS